MLRQLERIVGPRPACRNAGVFAAAVESSAGDGHALARRMLSNGASMSDIQAVLGHQSIAVTSKIYAPYDVRSLREAYDRYSGAVE